MPPHQAPPTDGDDQERPPHPSEAPTARHPPAGKGSPASPLRDQLKELRRSRVRTALFDDPLPFMRLGSFVVRRPLGRGGMGTVLEAYDEELERPLAIKLLHETSDQANRTERLRREAKALAKLSHPNVVQVYSVGEVDGHAFIAMELVRGQTLHAWQHAPRGWRRCVEAYLQAGRGLEAAHAVGLVHRDFKPGNCIIDDDGRVRVLDFGLVRTAGTTKLDAPPDPSEPPSVDGSVADPPVTRPGSAIGTLAYMAPEQLAGEVATAKADQFSFCVALYQAIHGQLPFWGSTQRELASAIERGELRPPPRDRPAPQRLRRALERGLAARPDDRWPSMSALLSELSRIARPRYRWWVGSGLLGVGMTVVGAAMWHQTLVGQRCTGAVQELSEVWDDTRKSEIEAAILATDLPYAPDTWAWIERHLDAYAHAWVDGHTRTCEATALRHEQSVAVMDLKMGCLNRHRHALQAVVELLVQADAQVVEHGAKLVQTLPPLARCDDIEALEAQRPPPQDPALAADVQALRSQLARAEALRAAGKYAPALDELEPIVTKAQALGYMPLVAEARLGRGHARQSDGQYAAAEQDLRRAYALAVEHDHLQVEARAVAALTLVVGNQQSRHEEGLVWSETAMALARRQGDRVEVARSLSKRGNVLKNAGKYPQAQQHYERALEIFEAALGTDHLDVAAALNRLGAVLAHQGHYRRAQEYFEGSLAIRERTLGPDHPLVAYTLSNRGNILYVQEEYAPALRDLERAFAIRERALGDDHPDLATSLDHLGRVAMKRGRPGDAQAYFERAIQIWERALGAEHPRVAHGLVNLANALVEQDRDEDARFHYERALELQTRALGAVHPDLALSLTGLANLELDQGDYDRSRQHHERARQIREQALGPDHPMLAYSLVGLAKLALARGAFDTAREHATHALELRRAGEHPDPVELTAAYITLAKALWPDPSRRGHARELVEQARAPLDASIAEHREAITSLDRWLAEHPVR